MAKIPSTGRHRLYDTLAKTILQFLHGKHYVPMGVAALLDRLRIPSTQHALCKEIIAHLVDAGTLKRKRNQIWPVAVETCGVQGVLRMHPRGFGFVVPDTTASLSKDVFIPRHLMHDAVDGDRVEVEVVPASIASEKGPEGRIVCVLQRSRSHLAGTLREIAPDGTGYLYVPVLGPSRTVLVLDSKKDKLKVGDRVVLQVSVWGNVTEPTICELRHTLGHISDPSIDVLAAAEEFDLRTDFMPEALREAEQFGRAVSKQYLRSREDLRHLECVTIDPSTARDFDDAIAMHKDDQGHYHLSVHIADAAHYIPPGSYLDQEAQARCNSTYFPGQCLPMLPEALSNNLCSLRPRVLRLAVSVIMHFDTEGTLLHARIARSVIKSRKRFTYEQAYDIIQGKTKDKYAPMLKGMVELCMLLKKKRQARGSIDFALPDAVIDVDAHGSPQGVHIVEYDISHQLVEEYMLKANEIVATHFSQKGMQLLYRVHEEPSAENCQEFVQLARTLGYTLPIHPTQQDLQGLFEDAKNTPMAYQLSVGFIRSMKLATYSPDNVGHYGLALENYCHFTSPIRRYSDTVTQRLLFGEQPLDTDLQQIALRCSEQERVSFRAESSVKTLKKLRLLQRYFEENPARIYDAQVTRIKPFGLFFDVSSLMIEGFLHISALENDYFIFDPKRSLLFGRNTGLTHALGKFVRVRLLGVDCILQESRWELAVLSSHKHQSPPQQHTRRKTRRRKR